MNISRVIPPYSIATHHFRSFAGTSYPFPIIPPQISEIFAGIIKMNMSLRAPERSSLLIETRGLLREVRPRDVIFKITETLAK